MLTSLYDRSRPVITVVDAKPMDQVGFRDVTSISPTDTPAQPPKPTKKGRPEITIVDAKPMNEVGFRDVNSITNNQSGTSPVNPSQSAVNPSAGDATAGNSDHLYAEIPSTAKGEPPKRPKGENHPQVQ